MAAARGRRVLAFGNVSDMNLEPGGADVVVASALWHMEPTIDRAVDLLGQGRFAAEDYRAWSMMRNGGASLSSYHGFERHIPNAVKRRVADTARRIRAGAFVVPVDESRPASDF